jgi:hypothetical protein
MIERAGRTTQLLRLWCPHFGDRFTLHMTLHGRHRLKALIYLLHCRGKRA